MRALKLLASIALVTAAAFGTTITVTITPSIGPSATSANLQTYENNAVTSLMAGGNPNEGTVNTPGYYTPILSGPISPLGFITTTYPSWLGQTNPATPYNNETGNAVFFGLTAVATGGTFDINDIGFFLTGQGTMNLAPIQFSSNNVGFDGTATPVATTGNAATDDTQALTSFYTSGLFFDVVVSDPSQVQNVIDTDLAGTGNSAGYILNGTGGPFSAQITFDIPDTQVVPEPATMGLMALGLAGVYAFRRRFAKR